MPVNTAISLLPARAFGQWFAANRFLLLFMAFALIQAVPFCRRTDSEWDEVYVVAAAHMASGGDIYDGPVIYAYPPLPAFCAVPFARLAPSADRLIFYAINLAALLVLCRCAWRLAGGQGTEELAWWLGMFCAFRFSLDGFAHQQTDVVIGGLLLGGCWALSRTRALTAAILWGLAAALKCTPLLGTGYLLWRGQWKAALLLVAVAVGANMLPDLVYRCPNGEPWLARWYKTCLQPNRRADFYPGTWASAIHFNQSLSGAVNRLLVTEGVWRDGDLTERLRDDAPSPQTAWRIYYALAAVVGLIALFSIGRPRASVPLFAEGPQPHRLALECSVVLIMMLLLSPMSSKPHFCTLLLPAFCVARAAVRSRSGGLFALVGVGIVLNAIAARDLCGYHVSVLALWWSAVTWVALLLLAGCCWLLSRSRLPDGTLAGSNQHNLPSHQETCSI